MEAAIIRKLKFELGVWKTVVRGVSVLDTEGSSSRHVSTIGGKPDRATRKCHEVLTKNSLRGGRLRASAAGECRGVGVGRLCSPRTGLSTRPPLTHHCHTHLHAPTPPRP